MVKGLPCCIVHIWYIYESLFIFTPLSCGGLHYPEYTRKVGDAFVAVPLCRNVILCNNVLVGGISSLLSALTGLV